MQFCNNLDHDYCKTTLVNKDVVNINLDKLQNKLLKKYNYLTLIEEENTIMTKRKLLKYIIELYQLKVIDRNNLPKNIK